MKQQEQDIERFAAIVREYHRQAQVIARDSYGTANPNMRAKRDKAYRDACDTLQDEIGEERMEAAREAYDERCFRQAEAREDAWIESHYR